LPDLVNNGYYLLGYDWREHARQWARVGAKTPPVLITIANRTETAARVKYAFDQRKILIEELCEPARTLHIDSKELHRAEAAEEAMTRIQTDEGEDGEESAGTNGKLTKQQRAELLRLTVDTVGRLGQPGEQIQNVISVGMLSEGWDSKTVTHIMGLRAFTSQLLCEQVVGRGLRRTSYELKKTTHPATGMPTELFEAEYVNIFGVPFTFLPHEGGDGPPPPPSPPKTAIEPDFTKAAFEVTWPNVLRINDVYRPQLSLDWSKVRPIELNASQTPQVAELAPIVEGKPDVSRIAAIVLERLASEFRMQRIVFEVARDVFDQMRGSWQGNREYLLVQIVRLVQSFIESDRLSIVPALFFQDDLRRRLIITLNMTRVVHHVWEAIRFENTEASGIEFGDPPVRSTGNMRTWYTGRACGAPKRSHINFCVYDSTWEACEAYTLDHAPGVESWVKNDHLGFEVHYVYRGIVRKYRPDFIVRLANGRHLILETKGEDTDRDQTKRRFLDEWVRAVNAHGGFGNWCWDVSHDPGDVPDILAKHL
jgi:type III restriction enzyme